MTTLIAHILSNLVSCWKVSGIVPVSGIENPLVNQETLTEVTYKDLREVKLPKDSGIVPVTFMAHKSLSYQYISPMRSYICHKSVKAPMEEGRVPVTESSPNFLHW